MSRNCEYQFVADPDSAAQANIGEHYTKLRDSLYSSGGFFKSKGPQERSNNPVSKVIDYPNKSVYGFGGPTGISSAYSRVGA